MLLLLFVGLFLMCTGMSVVFMFYLCILWYSSIRSPPQQPRARSGEGGGGEEGKRKGLSSSELRVLPGAQEGGMEVAGTECAVCLDDIECGQPARVLHTCGHAFHRRCADTWLSSNPACPLCRANLQLSSSPTPPPPAPPSTPIAPPH